MVSLPSQISAFCALAARSPCICSRLRVALRCAQQPTGLTLPSGALRVALGLRPKCPQGTRFPSRPAGVWGRLPVAQSSRRALAAPTARFAPSKISAFCALSARSPCICSRLRVALPPLAATAHRADASLRCPKPCAAAQKSERCECPKGTRNAPRSTPPRISAQTARPSSTRRGRAASISKNIIIGKTRVSRVPSVARNARRALPPETLASSCVFLHQAAFLASRLLNHSRFPDGRAHGFAVPLRVALPPPVASAHRAHAFLRAFGRSQRSRKMLRHKALGRRKEACALWALGPEGAKATWRRGAKRAAGAASAHRDD